MPPPRSAGSRRRFAAGDLDGAMTVEIDGSGPELFGFILEIGDAEAWLAAHR